MKKHVNPKVFLHQVYTEEGGVKEHNKNQRAFGALIFAGIVLAAQVINRAAEKFTNRPIKALEHKKGGNKSC